MSQILPVKPFQPLPPLVRMECIRDTPKKDRNHQNDTEHWMMDSPTNRSVALLVTNSSGISHTDTTLPSTTTTTTAAAISSPNDHSSSHSDLWNPLMMMMDDDDNNDDGDHHPDVDCILDVTTEGDDPLLEDSYNPISHHHTTAKRVSLDVVSDSAGGSDMTMMAMTMMDVDATHPESLQLLPQQYPHSDFTMMTSNDDHHHHDFELMEGLEHDPLLTLSVVTGGVGGGSSIHDDMVDTIGSSSSHHYTTTRMSHQLPNFIESSIPQRLPSLRRLLSGHENDYNENENNLDHHYDDMNDPWTKAANQAATAAAFHDHDDDDDDEEDDPNHDLMVFEMDQSFIKANGHMTTTVGTESTVSSYSSVAPDLLSVFTTTAGENHHHHRTAMTSTNHHSNSVVPTFFTSQQFQERCQLLSESMRASQLSRQCLSLQENIKLRANLAKVLKDIERSTAKVQRHCLSQQIQSSPSSSSQQQQQSSTSPPSTSTSILETNEINNDLLDKFENDVVNHDTTRMKGDVLDHHTNPITTDAAQPSSTF